MKFKVSEPKYTKEMEDWFVKRTNDHIKAVRQYCSKIGTLYNRQFGELYRKSAPHDQDKFREPERTPYIFITWMYRCKQEGISYNPPEEMKPKMDEATAHHIKNSKHHPEYWTDITTNLVNPDARDEASQVIDATKMPDIYIAEMVADWLAVSKERNNPVKFWAAKNINKRWMYNPRQVELIYELIDKIKQ